LSRDSEGNLIAPGPTFGGTPPKRGTPPKGPLSIVGANISFTCCDFLVFLFAFLNLELKSLNFLFLNSAGFFTMFMWFVYFILYQYVKKP
jgi:hypothetical protein